ncbi:hypothetical protein SNE40_022052 [Patella caerulea]|uniref:Tyr recombinase domain-containing protein n=1 Tax=Patella caerulea TaxID=87958 RepID=A0AAN8GH22_PATCE
MLLMGVKRELGLAQIPVDVITPDILFKIKSVLSFNKVFDHAFWCACLTAFFGLLRPGNVTAASTFDPNKDLRRTDLLLCSWGYLLSLRYSKTVQFREKEITVCLPRIDNPLCPAKAFDTSLDRTTSADPLGPLFIVDNSTCLTYRGFSSKLHEVLSFAGVPNSNIKGHSFRRGCATWLHRIGIPKDTIKAIGYWSSEAVMRYIDTDFSHKVHTMTAFGESFTNP